MFFKPKNLLLCFIIFCVFSDQIYPSQFPNTLDTCCIGNRGNADGSIDDIVDVGDLTALIDYLFISFTEPECHDEANVDGLGTIDIGDITALIDYLFINFTPPTICPSLIEIVNLQYGDNFVYGTANLDDTNNYKVVLWAKTDRWYIQPFSSDPYTDIQGNGSWVNFTHPWDRIVALLIDSNYVVEAIKDYHPSTDLGVIDWDEFPNKSVKYIYWSSYRWLVKNGDLLGPGPNYFSHDTSNVSLDQFNRLHLNLDFRDNKWYCAEVVLDHSLGYGTYTFQLESRVDSLNFNSIFAGFIYETINQEFDMEFSQILANPYNAQYVVQPWYTAGNIEFYHMPANYQTTHSFEWRSDKIIFQSWSGHASSSTPSTLIHYWEYYGTDIPPPGGERMRFNLYLFGGDPPSQGIEDEVIIRSFEFIE